MASLGRGIAAALSGTLKGLAAGAEREDERRLEMTKTTVASQIERSDEARKQHLANIQKEKDFTAAIDTLRSVQYYDPATKKYKSPTREEAILTYNTYGDEAVEALTDGNIYFEGEGKIIPGKSTKIGQIGDATAGAIKEGTGLFGRGRTGAVSKESREYLETLGVPLEGYELTDMPTVEGLSIRKRQEDDDITVHKSGVMRIELDGEEQFVEGIIAGNGTYKIRQGGKLVDAPVGATFHARPEPAPQKSSDDIFQDAYDTFGKQLTTNQTNLDNVRLGALKSTETMQQMHEIVSQNPEVFSRVATATGSALKRVQTELDGISFVLGDDGKATSDSVQKNLSLLDSFVEANLASTDLAVKAKVLDAITIRTAYAFLQAQGETRPTDRDLSLAAEQLSAGSKDEFYAKLESSRRSLQDGVDNAYEQYYNSDFFKYFQSDVSPAHKEAKEHARKVFAPLRKPTIPTFEKPAEVVTSSADKVSTANLPKIVQTPNIVVEHKTDRSGMTVAIQYLPQGGGSSRVVITGADGRTKDMTKEQAQRKGWLPATSEKSN